MNKTRALLIGVFTALTTMLLLYFLVVRPRMQSGGATEKASGEVATGDTRQESRSATPIEATPEPASA